MQRWEYLFIGVADTKHEDPSRWQAKHSNDGEIRGWRGGARLPQFVNNLGDEGWELVGAWAATQVEGRITIPFSCLSDPRHNKPVNDGCKAESLEKKGGAGGAEGCACIGEGAG